MRDYTHRILESKYVSNSQEHRELFDIALELEKVALQDEYFISRKLFPNVDFYTGVVMHAMGLPLSMFTVVFAVARTIGWISQWSESLEEESFKISRPRQL